MMKRVGIAIALLAALWVGGSVSAQESITFSDITDTSVTLSWTGGTADVSGWRGAGLSVCDNNVGLSRLVRVDRGVGSPHAFGGLAASTRYCFRVVFGSQSEVGGFVTTGAAAAPPGKVDAFSVVAGNVDFSLALSWTNPTSNPAVTGVEIQRKSGDGAFGTIVEPADSGVIDSYQDTGLTGGTTYTYRVRAVNSEGNGGWSSEASATVLAPYLFYADQIGTNGARLNWNNPDGLTISSSLPLTLRGTCQSALGVSSTIGPFLITIQTVTSRAVPLTADTTCNATLTYGGTGGRDAKWRPLSFRTAFTNGPVVTIDPSTTQAVNVRWTMITGATRGYEVSRSEDGGATWMSLATVPTGLRYTDESVELATTYQYRVRALGAGSSISTWSVARTATTPAAVAPSAPRNVSAAPPTPPVRGQIQLIWDAPAMTGAAAVSGFLIERGTTREGPWTRISQGSDNLHFLDTGLADGTGYYYRIAAQNAAGVGPWSAVVFATTDTGPIIGGFHVPLADTNTYVLTYAGQTDPAHTEGGLRADDIVEMIFVGDCHSFAQCVRADGRNDTGVEFRTSVSLSDMPLVGGAPAQFAITWKTGSFYVGTASANRTAVI